MTCIQVRSFHVHLQLNGATAAKEQKLIADFEGLLRIQELLIDFGELKAVCQVILERAADWQLCKGCEGIKVQSCVVTFYEQIDKQGRVLAEVNVLNGDVKVVEGRLRLPKHRGFAALSK